jgi:hypothetical protein
MTRYILLAKPAGKRLIIKVLRHVLGWSCVSNIIQLRLKEGAPVHKTQAPVNRVSDMLCESFLQSVGQK